MLVLGGHGSPGDLTRADVYIISDGNLAYSGPSTDIMYRWFEGDSVMHDGKVYLTGGKATNVTTWHVAGNKASVYDISQATWELLPNLNANRKYGPCTFTLKETLYTLAGDYGLETMESLDLNDIAAGWVESVPLPAAVGRQACIAVHDKVYVSGGTGGKNTIIIPSQRNSMAGAPPAAPVWVLPYLGMVGRFHGDDPHFGNFQSEWVPTLYRSTIRLTPYFCRNNRIVSITFSSRDTRT